MIILTALLWIYILGSLLGISAYVFDFTIRGVSMRDTFKETAGSGQTGVTLGKVVQVVILGGLGFLSDPITGSVVIITAIGSILIVDHSRTSGE